MRCKLCLKENKLVKAHIIPDFMYEDIIANGGIFKLSKFRKPKKIPTGEYDSTILCGTCDNDIINKKYEDYASKLYKLLSGKLTKLGSIKVEKKVNPAGLNYTSISRLDYQRFKLFLLSILWRASVSSREFCGDVKLGQDEEILRRMIKNEDSKRLGDFPILIIDISKDIPVLRGATENPRRVKPNGNHFYYFFIQGITYSFFLSKSNLHPFAVNSISKSTEQIHIYHAPEGGGIPFLESIKKHYTGV